MRNSTMKSPALIGLLLPGALLGCAADDGPEKEPAATATVSPPQGAASVPSNAPGPITAPAQPPSGIAGGAAEDPVAMPAPSGSGGTAAVDDGETPPPDGADPAAPREDLGLGDGSDVITIGDSYMRTLELIPGLVPPMGIEVSLEKVSARDYRNFGSGGDLAANKAAAMINGVVKMQYTTAKGANPNIATVVAAAGGNDAPEGNNACAGAATEAARSPACVEVCEAVNQAVADLLSQMAADGVKDVVWITYASTLMAQGVNYTGFIQGIRAGLVQRCVTDNPDWGGMRCHLIDSDPIINREFQPDGVHPSAAAYDRLGSAVWERMQAAGLRR